MMIAGLLRLAAKTLERKGFSVATAASGADAIAWLQASRPDLLLLDLKLQDCDARPGHPPTLRPQSSAPVPDHHRTGR